MTIRRRLKKVFSRKTKRNSTGHASGNKEAATHHDRGEQHKQQKQQQACEEAGDKQSPACALIVVKPDDDADAPRPRLSRRRLSRRLSNGFSALLRRFSTVSLVTAPPSSSSSRCGTQPMASGTLQRSKSREITRKYQFHRKLGDGSHAAVHAVRRKTDGKRFAVKIMRKKELTARQVERVQREVDLYANLSHTNIVDYEESFETAECFYIVIEQLDGGDLFDELIQNGPLSQCAAAKCTAAVCQGLRYLQENQVAHRDVKPENIMFERRGDAASVKLIDFGFARKAAMTVDGQAGTMRTWCGSLEYTAPEILVESPYTQSCDMWSLGVVLYAMVSGELPFGNAQDPGICARIVAGRFDFSTSAWDNIGPSCRSLVSGLLAVDAEERLTVDQVLEHPWIRTAAATTTNSPN